MIIEARDIENLRRPNRAYECICPRCYASRTSYNKALDDVIKLIASISEREEGEQMNFKNYQRVSKLTAIYPDRGKNFIYPTLGLVGEAGEVAEKIKKVIRDNKNILSPEVRATVAKELGDVLWYVAQVATELQLDMEIIAVDNLRKLFDRQARDQLHGEGDER